MSSRKIIPAVDEVASWPNGCGQASCRFQTLHSFELGIISNVCDKIFVDEGLPNNYTLRYHTGTSGRH